MKFAPLATLVATPLETLCTPVSERLSMNQPTVLVAVGRNAMPEGSIVYASRTRTVRPAKAASGTVRLTNVASVAAGNEVFGSDVPACVNPSIHETPSSLETCTRPTSIAVAMPRRLSHVMAAEALAT